VFACWLQEEIASKTAQLKALWGQYQARKAEGGDLQVRHPERVSWTALLSAGIQLLCG
jgi:hypothetical protein